MGRIVFIGQQPGSVDDEGLTLPIRPNSSGDRLAKMMGIPLEEFQRFPKVNVSQFHDPDGFSAAYHQVSVRNMLPLLDDKKCILLGQAVAEAFGLRHGSYDYACWMDYLSNQDITDNLQITVAVIPHPSGLNRLYNDPDVYRMVSSFLQQCWEERNE